jgi:signal transduction histidine kinase
MFTVFYNLTEVVLKNIETDNVILKQSAKDAQNDYKSIFSGIVIFGVLFTVLLALFTVYVNRAIILYVSQLKKHQNHLEELVRERTQELHESNLSLVDKTKNLEKSQTAMRYLIEDVNSSRDELNKANEKLYSANEELGAFTHTVSHDLRAPLRAIIGYSNIFIEDYEDLIDEDGKEVLDNIKTATVKMQNLINDLLVFSKVGRSVINKQKVNTKEMFNQQFTELSAFETSRNINFEISDSIPDIQADKVLFSQILQNLIGNAVKYTQKKKLLGSR